MKNLIYLLMIVPALSFGQFGAHVGFSSAKAKVSGGGVSVIDKLNFSLLLF